MQRKRLRSVGDEFFNEAWLLYAETFPRGEQRDIDVQQLVMENPRYSFDVLVGGNGFQGFLLWWQFQGLRFVEHVATSPALRGAGLGASILKSFIEESDEMVVVEVDLPNDEISRRRVGFYERLGFVMSSYPYKQPPYRKCDSPLPLRIMSYPQAVDDDTMRYFVTDCHAEIYLLRA